MFGVIKLTFSCILLFNFVPAVIAPGGWQAANSDDEDVQRIAKEAVAQHDSQSNSLFTSQVLKIVEAETQVIAGINYRLTVDIGYTSCRKNARQEARECKTQQVQRCKFVMWERLWLNQLELTDTSCGPIKSVESNENDVHSLPLPGGVHDTTETADVTDAASFAVTRLESTADGIYSVQLNRVVKATKQVVAGVLYKMTIECHLSSCRSNGYLGDCKTDIRKEAALCDVEVWDQSWRDPRYILRSYKCSGLQLNEDETASADEEDEAEDLLFQFETFKKQHRKQYNGIDEEARRFSIFKENLKRIKFLQDHELGSATYGPTQFADLTPEEFRRHYLSPVWDKSEDKRLTPAVIPNVAPPTEYDWRHFNTVTPVKNQGSCGSCWAFSVTGNIEGQWAIQKKKLVSLSEQELVDCDKLDEGCNGGLPSYAYMEIQRLGGLESETDYPYKGRDDSCHLKTQDIRVYINGSLNISKDEKEMAAWLYKNGPMSIGINAFAMQFYFGGISHPWKVFCSPDALDHGVLIVGYGIKKGIFSDSPYWIVKNSWGTFWGESGYYLVYRGDGTCGLNEMVSSAIVK